MTTVVSPTVDELLGAVYELEPVLVAHAEEAEREKHLSRPVVQAMRDAGLFRMFRPESRGGLELDPVSEFRIAEAVAQIDSAAAWNLQVCNASELFGAWFSDEVSEVVFGSPHSVVAGAFNPHRRAESVDGGYRMSGRTWFNSNCHGATWFIGLANVYDGDEMRLDGQGQPETLLTLLSASEMSIQENWNTMGMCGTGSHDVEARNVFVPTSHAVPFGPLERPAAAYDGPLAPLAIWATVGCHASVSIGVAQAAIDELLALGQKVPAYTDRSIRDRSMVQLRLAQAEGKLGGSRAYFHKVYGEAWDAARANGCLNMNQKARCQIGASQVVSVAAEVVDLVHSCVGATGIRNEQRFQRHFRDAHVMTQHAFVSESRLESAGQVMFGLQPDWPFFEF